MNENLEKKLRKTALLSGLSFKATSWGIGLASGYHLLNESPENAALYAGISFGVGITGYALLSYSGVSFIISSRKKWEKENSAINQKI